ncbi:unnamed protein product [Urochloa decumbens]|uniref:Uncharacterized protein n=1 Tax=Urochloa decumbens TaxID=240449 RepID=A0ABC9GDI9_9POAL
MPSTMVDATVSTPPLNLTARRRGRPASLSNTNGATCVAAALSGANTNAGAGAVVAAPKPKSKTVASRYLIPSTAKSPPAAFAERPRLAPPCTVAVALSGSAATTTTRTLAVAFQSPTYSLESTRARSGSPAAAAAAAATPTPEKIRPGSTPGTAAHAKVSDASQNTYRWPTSSEATAPPRGVHDGRIALAANDKSPERSAPSRKQSAAAAARPAAFHGTPRRASVDGGANEYLLAVSSDDTDSASSSGGSGDGAPPRRSVGSGAPRPSPRSAAAVMMSSSARFTRDAMVGTRSDRFAYAATPSPSRASGTASPAPAPVKKRSLLNGLLSSPFGRSSLKQPVARSSFRRTASPSPARRSTEVLGSAGNTQCRASSAGCGFDRDTRLKPSSAIKAEEEHQLRLLYTQHLQWRLVNAQAGAALSLQTTAAEKTLSGAWIAILRTRKSVAIRKMQLQLLRNNCKLMAVLRGQMKYLEELSFLERDYAHSLSGTTQALNATVLRLPVSNGAIADIQGIENALSSAFDAMHTIGNSTSTQLPKRLAVHTSINAREVQQPTRTKNTAEPKKASAFSVVFRLLSPVSTDAERQLWLVKMKLC